MTWISKTFKKKKNIKQPILNDKPKPFEYRIIIGIWTDHTGKQPEGHIYFPSEHRLYFRIPFGDNFKNYSMFILYYDKEHVNQYNPGYNKINDLWNQYKKFVRFGGRI